MEGLKNYKSCIDGENFIFVYDVTKFGMTRREAMEKLGFAKYLEPMMMTLDDFEGILNAHCITDRHLFAFSVFNGILLYDDGVYTEKWEPKNDMVKTYHNVYLSAYPYLSVILNRYAEEWAMKKIPVLNNRAFKKMEYRFPESVRKAWPISKDANMDDALNGLSVESGSITVDDFINIHTKKDYVNSKVCKPAFSCYCDGSIFIETGQECNLHTSFKELVEKDWEAIEKHYVFSIPNGVDEDGNNQYYSGEQKGAPYFDCPIVGKLRKLL